MLRTHTCGELRINHVEQTVTISGWVQGMRDKGSLLWIDLRDRYGITQITIETENASKEIVDVARSLGREYVISVTGKVTERYSKSDKIETGAIEITPEKITVLNSAIVPPFTIEDETDGGDDIRMKYRYLDLRRNPVRKNLELRHRMAIETRNFLDKLNFLEVETPVLIKSTPEGARDFIVPSRMNQGEFYALPQSPQTFKQLLMVGGFDRYYQIVKCFRDEDLRADRQPEFTQIDCEMAFVEQEDILDTFEELVRHLFKTVKNIDIPALTRMTYSDAMKFYGNDKPDIRFEMKFVELNDVVKGKGFPVFDNAKLVVGICAKGAAEYTRKQLDELTEFVKRPQVGATGLVYARYNTDGTIKSSVDKFYNEEELKKWALAFNAQPGDLMLILAGEENKTRKALSELRNHIARKIYKNVEIINRQDGFYSIRIDSRWMNLTEVFLLKMAKEKLDENKFVVVKYTENKVEIILGNLFIQLPSNFFDIVVYSSKKKEIRKRPHYFIFTSESYNNIDSLREILDFEFNPFNKNKFAAHWVVDFPMFEYNEEDKRLYAMHHPFTSPKPEDIGLLQTNPGAIRANAYDMVINGVEIGGGSIRIFNKELQAQVFSLLGFTKEDAQAQFGFLMNAFEFGAPPHGGIAFGFDRLCSLFGGADVIRDFIAFPKNNSGRDVMIDSPSPIAQAQLDELAISLKK